MAHSYESESELSQDPIEIEGSGSEIDLDEEGSAARKTSERKLRATEECDRSVRARAGREGDWCTGFWQCWNDDLKLNCWIRGCASETEVKWSESADEFLPSFNDEYVAIQLELMGWDLVGVLNMARCSRHGSEKQRRDPEDHEQSKRFENLSFEL